jgi:hypothetical protein
MQYPYPIGQIWNYDEIRKKTNQEKYQKILSIQIKFIKTLHKFHKMKSNGLSFDVTVNRLIERNTDC